MQRPLPVLNWHLEAQSLPRRDSGSWRSRLTLPVCTGTGLRCEAGRSAAARLCSRWFSAAKDFAEVHLHVRRHFEAGMLRHLRSAVPGQCLHQVPGQRYRSMSAGAASACGRWIPPRCLMCQCTMPLLRPPPDPSSGSPQLPRCCIDRLRSPPHFAALDRPARRSDAEHSFR